MVESRSVAGRSKGRASFAVLWDLDGVLVDTGRYHLESWRQLLAELGKTISEEEFRASFGLRNSDVLPRWLPGISEAEVAQLSERKESLFRKLLPDRIPLLPGVDRLVRKLADERVPQAIASSTPVANLVEILPRLRLPLTEYVAAEDVREGKPAPEVFLKAAERLSVLPERCVVVEDSVAGVQAAHRAGMACLALTSSWPRERLRDADRVVDSLEEVSVGDLRELVMRRRAGAGL